MYTFYSPPHFIHFWCYILHICLYHLNIACNYNWFYGLYLSTFVLVFLTGWSIVFIAYLLLLVRFFSKYILSHSMTFSFSIKGDPLTFLVRPVQWCWIFLVFAYLGKSFSFHQFWIITLPNNTYGTLLLVVILFQHFKYIMLIHSGLQNSAENLLITLWEFPLFVTVWFSLADLKILPLTFAIFFVYDLMWFSLSLSCLGFFPGNEHLFSSSD